MRACRLHAYEIAEPSIPALKVCGVQETRWYRELGPFVLVSEGSYLFSAYGRYMIRSVCKQVRSKTEEVKRFE